MPDKTNNNVNVEKALKAKNVTAGNVTYSNGVSASASIFNSLVKDIKEKADREKSKAKYRFLNNNINGNNYLYKMQEIYNIVEEIQKRLSEYNYTVKVFEDLDCEDVDKQRRYFIRISKNDKVYSTIDLSEYEKNIRNFEFDEKEFIENIVCKIEGYSSEKTKIITDNIVECISNIIYFKSLYYLTYSKIGWEYYNNDTQGWIFKYDEIYTRLPFIKGEIKKNYEYGLGCSDNAIKINKEKVIKNILSEMELKNPNEINNDEVKEIKDILLTFNDYKWVRTTKDLISRYPYDALILGAGISGLIRQLLPYTKETNININISGEPASGKSTICHYLLGIFGNPELLEGSFTDTDNSMEFNRVKRPVLPYVLDERMLKIEASSDNVKRQKVFIDIFREYEGKIKERLGKQYEEFSGERTYGPVISSSVDNIMDVLYKYENNIGQYRRFIELNIEKEDLFSSSKEADNIENIAYSCYGYGVRIIVDYILYLLDNNTINNKKAEYLTSRFDELNIKIKDILEKREEIEKIGDLTSSSKRFALIVLSYQILREALEFYMDDFNNTNEMKDERYISKLRALEINKNNEDGGIIDLSDEIIKILTDNLISKMKHLDIVTNKNDNALYNYILSNSKQFIKVDKVDEKIAKTLNESKGNILGYYIIKDNEIELWTVYDYQLDIFWYMKSIPKPETIKEYIEYVEDEIKIKGKNNINENIADAKKKYNAISENAQGKIGRTNKKIDGKTVYFSKTIIKIDRPQVEEEQEEDTEGSQSKAKTRKPRESKKEGTTK